MSAFWDKADITGLSGSCLLLTQSGHRVGRWRSAGAVAEALSVNAKMVVPKRPGRFYGVRCQFLVPILCFDVDL
jgi:hypothetical protein